MDLITLCPLWKWSPKQARKQLLWHTGMLSTPLSRQYIFSRALPREKYMPRIVWISSFIYSCVSKAQIGLFTCGGADRSRGAAENIRGSSQKRRSLHYFVVRRLRSAIKFLGLCFMVVLNHLLTTNSFSVVHCEKIKIYHQAETSKKMSLWED